MQIIPIIVILFGLAGVALSIYLRLTVESPILKTEDGKEVNAQQLSLQDILNMVFVYFAILHLIIALIGVNFLLST
ncbi:MAG: hypothetical protein ACE5I1_00165 [bacterium]